MSVLRWNHQRAWMRGVAMVAIAAVVLLVDVAAFWRGGPLLGGGAAAAAESGPKRRVALFVLPKRRGMEEDAKALQSLLRGELGKLQNVVAVGATADPPAPITRTVGPLLEAGFRALNDKQAGVAEEQFQKALGLLTAYRGPFDRRLFARTLKGLGVAQVMNGRGGEAEQMIIASLNLWPDQQVGEYGWTLDTRTTFRDIERRRAETAPGSIEVGTEPDGAAVYVNGQLRGFAPLEVPNLPAGQHWVEAVMDGRTRAGAFVDVQPGEGSMAQLDLDGIPDEREFDAALANVARLMKSNQVASPMSNLQRVTVADVVIALEVDKARDAYVIEGWIRVGAADVERQRVTLAEDAALLENGRNFMAGLLQTGREADDDLLALDGPPQASVMGNGDLFIDPNDPIFKADEKKKGDSITDKWWFWAIAGSVTAALVVGGVVLFSGDDEGSGPTGNLLINLHGLP